MTREEARNILDSLSSDLWRELHPSQRDALDMAIEALQEKRPHGEWVEDKNDADVRCSNCGIACQALNKSHHKSLNILTGGKWQTYYHFCPKCGAKMQANDKQVTGKLNSEIEKSKSEIVPDYRDGWRMRGEAE